MVLNAQEHVGRAGRTTITISASALRPIVDGDGSYSTVGARTESGALFRNHSCRLVRTYRRALPPKMTRLPTHASAMQRAPYSTGDSVPLA